MVTVELEPTSEDCLKKMAARHGQSVSQLARQILEDFLAFRNLSDDTSEDWAESSIALTPEILPPESWDEGK